MLRARTQRTTGSTGVTLTVTHGMGAVPDYWNVEPVSDRSQGRAYIVPATYLTNTIDVVCSIESTCTLDVFTVTYQGRLY